MRRAVLRAAAVLALLSARSGAGGFFAAGEAPDAEASLALARERPAPLSPAAAPALSGPRPYVPPDPSWVSVPAGPGTRPFLLQPAPVTVGEYAECVREYSWWNGTGCSQPHAGESCNWGVRGRERHPVNCIEHFQAEQYAAFIRGKRGFEKARLPAESEWAWAASGAGRFRLYPWGEEPPSCARAVMRSEDGAGCGRGSTWPVCSKPAGNTPLPGSARGLCDMSGNVSQWMGDRAHEYANLWWVRGGSFLTTQARDMQISFRVIGWPGMRGTLNADVGFRLARDP